jgi:hypothetical protein
MPYRVKEVIGCKNIRLLYGCAERGIARHIPILLVTMFVPAANITFIETHKEFTMRKILISGALFVFAIALAGAAEFAPRFASASSHREAPLISQDPAADNTDTYMFRDPVDTSKIDLIANYYPYEGPAGGPNYYRFGDDVRYEFNIDNDGDARAEIKYYFKFKTTILNSNTFLYNTGPVSSITDSDLTLKQTYNVFRVQGGVTTKLASGLLTPPDNVGCHTYSSGSFPPPSACSNSATNYHAIANAAINTIDTNIKVFAGQRKDPFFADVGSIFDLLTIRGGVPAGFSSGGVDLFGKYNVQTIALQVPITKLTKCGCVPSAGDFDNDVVGFWASNSRLPTRVLPSATAPRAASAADADTPEAINDPNWSQVSRLGLALVNEAVIPMAMKDKFNASKPVNDVANFAGPVTTPELATLLHVIYGLTIPPTPRTDLVNTLLTGVPTLNKPNGVVASDMLRLNVTTPLCSSCSTLGVIGGDNQGYPNGRRLTDDVIDISERVVAGVLNSDCGSPPCSWQGSPNNALGDGVNAPAVAPQAAFPYVPDPLDGFNYAGQ